eukprot:CAMPEP_0203683728 /NCGR_PEP_ID=MMETSP0090-20130426/47673_1 /ASSEMBLY_ACC=CAM_ASM_001088 /TAXON_ID=426623 /ORGANISM="Chaetoceros affinis, Strain CCMP159" /LENGTH=432 /DNA_ID=CAMNT_0050552883 /DNA_START=38 /DNA_END=1336 /DNA_ORIENTATION=+
MKPCTILISSLLLAISSNTLTEGFLPQRLVFFNKNVLQTQKQQQQQQQQQEYKSTTATTTSLFGGIGTTANYTWKEDQFEIELRIPVPAGTRAKHVTYKPKSKSMEVSIELEQGEKQILLHGQRQFRGLVDLDGTFWSLVDVDADAYAEGGTKSSTNSENSERGRELVISIEKLIVPPDDPFAVVDYDWGSVYMNDDDEILSKTYDEAEELDIREYAASLGVDIDNINMTMVDKSMFSSGLNLTRNTLDELTKSGYAKEFTSQGGGGDGGSGMDLFAEEGVAVKSLGDKIGDDEIEDAGIGISNKRNQGQSQPIPFLDTDSPWRKSMPVEEARGVEGDGSPFIGHESEGSNTEKKSDDDDEDEAPSSTSVKYQDPIDKLTVSKLKDILRKEGLKVSGNKNELQDRLKEHVASIMQRNKGTTQDSSTFGESGF